MTQRRTPSRSRARRVSHRVSHRRGLLAAIGGGVGVLLLASLYLLLLGTPPAGDAAIGGAFRLRASDGRVVTDRSFPGRYTLLYFGYSHCRDVCPATLATLAAALDRLGARADRVEPLFVTLDPARDTPAVLARYLAAFTPRLLGLTGAADQIRAMQRAFAVRSVAHPQPAGGVQIDHSSVLLLMDPQGAFAAAIRADDTAAGMAADIAAHLT